MKEILWGLVLQWPYFQIANDVWWWFGFVTIFWGSGKSTTYRVYSALKVQRKSDTRRRWLSIRPSWNHLEMQLRMDTCVKKRSLKLVIQLLFIQKVFVLCLDFIYMYVYQYNKRHFLFFCVLTTHWTVSARPITTLISVSIIIQCYIEIHNSTV